MNNLHKLYRKRNLALNLEQFLFWERKWTKKNRNWPPCTVHITQFIKISLMYMHVTIMSSTNKLIIDIVIN